MGPQTCSCSVPEGPQGWTALSPSLAVLGGGCPAPWSSQTTACATVCSWQQLPDATPAPLLPAAAAGGCVQGKAAPLPWAEPGIFSCPRPWTQLGGSHAPSSRVTYIVNCSILPGDFQWGCGNLDYQSDLGRLKPRSCGLHSPSSPSLRPTGNWGLGTWKLQPHITRAAGKDPGHLEALGPATERALALQKPLGSEEAIRHSGKGRNEPIRTLKAVPVTCQDSVAPCCKWAACTMHRGVSLGRNICGQLKRWTPSSQH